MNNEKKQQFFKMLVNDGFKFGPNNSYDEFETAMADSAKAKRLHDIAPKYGYRLDPFDKFYNDFRKEPAGTESANGLTVSSREDGTTYETGRPTVDAAAIKQAKANAEKPVEEMAAAQAETNTNEAVANAATGNAEEAAQAGTADTVKAETPANFDADTLRQRLNEYAQDKDTTAHAEEMRAANDTMASAISAEDAQKMSAEQDRIVGKQLKEESDDEAFWNNDAKPVWNRLESTHYAENEKKRSEFARLAAGTPAMNPYESTKDLGPLTAVESTLNDKEFNDRLGDYIMSRMGLNKNADQESGGDTRPMTEDELAAFDKKYEDVYKHMVGFVQKKIHDEYIKKDAPTNTLEYVMSKVFYDNLYSNITSAIKAQIDDNAGLRAQLRQQAFADYEKEYLNGISGAIVKGGTGAATLLVETPVFAASGGVGSLAARGTLEVADLVAKTGVKYLLTKSPIKLLNSMIASSVTLGTYEALGTTAQIGINNGIDPETGEPYTVEKLLSMYGHGFGTGAVVGVGGELFGAIGNRIGRANGMRLKDIGLTEDITKYIGNVGVFTTMGQMEEHGWNPMDWDWNQTLESAIQNATMFGIMDFKKMRERYKNGNIGEKFEWNDSDNENLKAAGYGELDYLMMRAIRGDVRSTEGSLATGREAQSVFEKLMADENVPIQTRRKVAAMAAGKVLPEARIYYTDIHENNGKIVVQTLTETGKVNERRVFDSIGKAKGFIEDAEAEKLGNIADLQVYMAGNLAKDIANDIDKTVDIKTGRKVSPIKEILAKNWWERTDKENSILERFTERVYNELRASRVDPRQRRIEDATNEDGTIRTAETKDGVNGFMKGDPTNDKTVIIVDEEGNKHHVSSDNIVETGEPVPANEALEAIVEAYDLEKGPQVGNVIWIRNDAGEWVEATVKSVNGNDVTTSAGPVPTAMVNDLQEEHDAEVAKQEAIEQKKAEIEATNDAVLPRMVKGRAMVKVDEDANGVTVQDPKTGEQDYLTYDEWEKCERVGAAVDATTDETPETKTPTTEAANEQAEAKAAEERAAQEAAEAEAKAKQEAEEQKRIEAKQKKLVKDLGTAKTIGQLDRLVEEYGDDPMDVATQNALENKRNELEAAAKAADAASTEGTAAAQAETEGEAKDDALSKLEAKQRKAEQEGRVPRYVALRDSFGQRDGRFVELWLRPEDITRDEDGTERFGGAMLWPDKQSVWHAEDGGQIVDWNFKPENLLPKEKNNADEGNKTEKTALGNESEAEAEQDSAAAGETATEEKAAGTETGKEKKQKRVFSDDAYEAAKARMRARMNRMNIGIDPEMLQDMLTMAGYHIENGVRKFADFCEKMIADLGDACRPYLKQIYQAAKYDADIEKLGVKDEEWTEERDVRRFDVENYAPKKTEGAGAEQALTPYEEYAPRYVEAVKKKIVGTMKWGDRKRTITDLRKIAADMGFKATDIQLQELTERAVVQLAKDAVAKCRQQGMSELETLKEVEKVYEAQPSINTRSSQREIKQQYSTPVPMAYSADVWVSRMPEFENKHGLEPCGGNGMMVFALPSENISVNDIDENRLANLRAGGFAAVTSQNALEPFGEKVYDYIVNNPPFGKSPIDKVKKGGFVLTGIDPQIVVNSLDAMKDDGRAAIIVGGHTGYDERGVITGKDNAFLGYLYDNYNVVDVINMSGDMYAKQGTTYPTRMILIAGRRDKSVDGRRRYAPLAKDARTEVVTTFEELLNRVINDEELLQSNGISFGVVDGRGDRKGYQTDGRNRGGEPDARNADGERTGRELGAGADGVSVRPTREGEGTAADGRGAGERGGDGRMGMEHADRREHDAAEQRPVEADGGGQGHGDVAHRDNKRGEGRKRGDARPSEPRDVAGPRRTDVDGGTAARPAADTTERNAGADKVDEGVGLAPKAETQETVRADRREQEKAEIGQAKVQYAPTSRNPFTLNAVMPANMAAAARAALADIESRNGDIDTWLTKELGYGSMDELYKALGAEQIDSVSMAIDNMKRGSGFIIGDMTGIGKGRQAAALIRWAVKNGNKPIFITENATLFSDIYRDLVDIGSGELKPFVFNAGSDADITDSDGVLVYKAYGSGSEEQKRVFESGKLPDDCDYAILSYSQVNRGDAQSMTESKRKPKDSDGKKKSATNPYLKGDYLRKIANGNVLILDESHNASGASNTGAYFVSILKDAKAVTFLSATYSKRPDTMPLYAMKTAMSEANVSSEEMIEIINQGGLPLMEVMSQTLTECKQLMRRERNMDGVEYEIVEMTDSPEMVEKSRKSYDNMIELMNDIINYQRTYIDPYIDNANDEAAWMQENAKHKQGTRDMGINNTPFASQTYNITKQMMLSLKTQYAAEFVDRLLKNDKKPVITLANTMESSYSDLAPIGGEIGNNDFAPILIRMFDKLFTMEYRSGGKKIGESKFTPAQIGPEAELAYRALKRKIENSVSGVSCTPVDDLIAELTRRGYKVGELTGRNTCVEYDANGVGHLRTRSKEEKDKKALTRKFNNGDIDVLIINVAGATGISLQNAPWFKDIKQRAEVNIQNQDDINKQIQVLGRTDRTGQKDHSLYYTISLPIPAETRQNIMFNNKVKALSATTTASKKAEQAREDVPDLLNEYGSAVIANYLRENPDLLEKMGSNPPNNLSPFVDWIMGRTNEDDPMPVDKEGDLARWITGRVALLNCEGQDKFYGEITESYNQYIQYLKESGQDKTDTEELPLRAKTLEKTVTSPGAKPNSGNPFADNAYLEKVEVDVLAKPMKAADVQKLMDKTWKADVSAGDERSAAEQHSAKARERATAYYDEKQQELEERIAEHDRKAEEKLKAAIEKATKAGKMTPEQLEQYEQQARSAMEEDNIQNANRQTQAFETQRRAGLMKYRYFKVGEPVRMPYNIEQGSVSSANTVPAIFVGYKQNGKKPTPSSVSMVFAVLDARKKVEIPMSQTQALANILNNTRGYGLEHTTLDSWDAQIPDEQREVAYIVTGNIIQAMRDAAGTGRLIKYTDIDGNIRTGVLMPKNYDASKLKPKAPIGQMRDYIMAGNSVTSADGTVTLMYRWGEYTLQVKSAAERKDMRKDPELLDMVRHNDLTRRSRYGVQWYEGQVEKENIGKLIDYLNAKRVDVGVKTNEETGEMEYAEYSNGREYMTASETPVRLSNESNVEYAKRINEYDIARSQESEKKMNDAVNGIVEAAAPAGSTDVDKAAAKAAVTQLANAIGKRKVEFIEQEGSYARMNDEAMAFTKTQEEFVLTLEDAVRNNGLVLDGLNDAGIGVVKIGGFNFDGKQPSEWAYNNLVTEKVVDKKIVYDDNLPELSDGTKFSVSKKAINEYIEKAGESTNKEAYLQTLPKLFDVIKNSVDAEIHPDYKKKNGVRSPENGHSNDVLIHRLYGAIEINGNVYPVKITMQEFINNGNIARPHAYEVIDIKIEPIGDETDGSGARGTSVSVSRIPAANVLKHFEKSYDSGKNILEESINNPYLQGRNSNEAMTVWHGSGAEFENFDTNFIGTGEGSQVYGYGFYVSNVKDTGMLYANIAAPKREVEVLMNGEPFGYNESDAANIARTALQTQGYSVDDAIDSIKWNYDTDDAPTNSDNRRKRAAREAVRMLENGAITVDQEKNRHLYEVEIPDDNGENYLDWTMPVDGNQYRQIMDAVMSYIDESGMSDTAKFNAKHHIENDIEESQTFGEVQMALMSAVGDKTTTDILSGLGYTGIKIPTGYKHGGDGRGMNYVIFRESDLSIKTHTEFMTLNDGRVYGWRDMETGKVYLTPLGVNPNTPLHEYGHAYAMALEQQNPRLWKRFTELLDTLPEETWKEIGKDYEKLDKAAMYREKFARWFGDRGGERLKQDTEEMIKDAKDWKSKGFVADLMGKIRQAIRQAKRWIAENIFGMKPETFRDVDDMFEKTYYDFANGFDPDGGGNGRRKAEKSAGTAAKTEAMLRPGENVLDYIRDVQEQLGQIKGEGDVRRLGDKLAAFVRNGINADMAKRMGAARINGMVNEINKAITRDELARPIMTLQEILGDANLSRAVADMNRTIVHKTRSKNSHGVGVGAYVDPETEKVFREIRSTFKALMQTKVDEDVASMNKELNALRAEAKEMAGVVYSDITKSMRDANAELDAKCLEIEERKSALDDLKDEQNRLQNATNEDELARVQEQMRELEEKYVSGEPLTDTEMELLMKVLPVREKVAQVRRLLNAPLTGGTGGVNAYRNEMWRERKAAARVKPAGMRPDDIYASPNRSAWLEYDQHMQRIDELQEALVEAQHEAMLKADDVAAMLKEMLGEGAEKWAAMRTEEMNRKKELVAMAVRAVKRELLPAAGEEYRKRSIGRKMWDALFSPLKSIEFMLQYVDVNHHMGDGPLYEYFVKDPQHGLIARQDLMYDRKAAFNDAIDKKVGEILGTKEGKGMDRMKKMLDEEMPEPINRTVSKRDIADSEKNYGENTVGELGDPYEEKMTKGHALYLWATWRQQDGMMKMKAAGFTQKSMDQIERLLGDELLSFGEWVTDTFLPELREEYDKTHVMLHGTHMMQIPHYFPLKIEQRSISDKNVMEQSRQYEPSVDVANVIERTHNILPVEAGVDFLETLVGYGREMEQWNAMAPVIRDFNTLGSSKTFKNFLDQSHPDARKDFFDAARIACWADYMREVNPIDGFFNKLISAGATSAIAFNLNTALKQFVSGPLLMRYGNSKEFYGELLLNLPRQLSFVNGGGVMQNNYEWCKENLPSFRQRIRTGDLGVDALSDKSYMEQFREKYGRIGLGPNRLIDAMTIAWGARAIYNEAYRNFKKQGMSDEDAHTRAVIEAELAYNATQQSNIPWSNSPVQKSTSPIARSMTLFQNSNISYSRILNECLIGMKRTKYLEDKAVKKRMAAGATEEEARKAERKESWKKIREYMAGALTMCLVGYGLWNAIGHLSTFLNGDGDDDDMVKLDKEDAKKLTLQTAAGSMFYGTALGPLVNGLLSGYGYEMFPALGDMKYMYDKYKGADFENEDLVTAAGIDVAIRMLQYGAGISVEKWKNIMNGVYGMVTEENGGTDFANYMLMANMPKSEREGFVAKLYAKDGPIVFAEKMQKVRATMNTKNGIEAFAKSLIGTDREALKDMNNTRKAQLFEAYVKAQSAGMYNDLTEMERWYNDYKRRIDDNAKAGVKMEPTEKDERMLNDKRIIALAKSGLFDMWHGDDERYGLKHDFYNAMDYSDDSTPERRNEFDKLMRDHLRYMIDVWKSIDEELK